MKAGTAPVETGEMVPISEAALALGMRYSKCQGLVLAGVLKGARVAGKWQVLSSSVEEERQRQLNALEAKTPAEEAIVNAAIEDRSQTVPMVIKAIERARATAEMEVESAKRSTKLFHELNPRAAR